MANGKHLRDRGVLYQPKSEVVWFGAAGARFHSPEHFGNVGLRRVLRARWHIGKALTGLRRGTIAVQWQEQGPQPTWVWCPEASGRWSQPCPMILDV